MAVNRPDGDKGNQGKTEAPEKAQIDHGAGASAGPTGPSAGGPAPGAAPSRRGMSSVRQRIQRGMNKNRMSEILAEFGKAMENVSESIQENALEYQVLALDNQKHQLHYSGIVLTGATKIDGQLVVSVYTMILEGSNTKPRPVNMNFYNQQVEVVLTPMDAWDNTTWEKVKEVALADYGNEAKILMAGATTIPEEIDPSDSSRIWRITWAAHEAIHSTIETMYPQYFEHFSIPEYFDRQQDQITAAFTYNGVDGETVTGMPVRSDIHMAVQSTKRQQGSWDNNFSNFQHQSTMELMEACAYVDLVYAPPMEQPTYNQQPVTQMFWPRVVLTKIDALDNAPYTPEFFFLALATMQLLGQNYSWAWQFANYHQEEVHNIGAIGYRLPDPKDPTQPMGRIDTSSNNFDQTALSDLVRTACHANPIFSIDCEDVGPYSWLTGDLVAAAHGVGEAHNSLIQSVDNLTNGHFSRHFQGGPIVHTENNRVHIGTYNNNGELRDLREIDSLAILNLMGHNDMNVVNQWESTFNDSSAPIEMRLEKRLGILSNLLQKKLNVRGFAERLTFAPEFLSALVNATIDAGLAVDPNGLQQMVGNNYQVGNSIIGNYAVQNSGLNGMLNTGGPTGPIAQRGPITRW